MEVWSTGWGGNVELTTCREVTLCFVFLEAIYYSQLPFWSLVAVNIEPFYTLKGVDEVLLALFLGW